MKSNIITISSRPPDWVASAYQEYAKRLPRNYQLVLKELPLARRSKLINVEQVKQKEGQQLLAAIPDNNVVIILEVQGKAWTTQQLAEHLQTWHDDNQDISLLIGGPDGLSQDCLKRADIAWSLSTLTLPHLLVRIIVAEQIYRAWSVLHSHPYHRN